MLVNPKQFPHPEATARASGADDVLAAARVVGSLPEALAGCGFVAATTSRDRDQYFRVIDVREAALRLVTEARRAPAAVVFGAERTGLTNEELESAHALIRIPANPDYPSLNLAMAVQLVSYELFRARDAPQLGQPRRSRRWRVRRRWQRLYAHFAQVLEEIDFRDRTAERHAPDEPHPALPAARRARPERSQHPARHSHRGAEPPPPRRRGASVSAAHALSGLRGHHAGGSGRGRGHERVPYGGR